MADIDASETVTADTKPAELAIAPAVAPKRRSAVWPVLGGIVAAAAGFSVAQLVPNGWPIGNTSALEARLATELTQVDALKSQVLELSQRSDKAAALVDRVAKLEATPALGQPVDTSALEARIATLEARPNGPSGDPVGLAQLRAEIDVLKARGAGIVSPAVQQGLDAKVKETEAKLAAIEAAAKASAEAALTRSALRQIAASLDSGTAYGAAAADLKGADLPAILAEHAATGLPTMQSLQADFPAAARAALDAALRANMGATWTERVSNFLRTQTGARALAPREGTDPDAILSRAEAATAAGDLAAALTEIAGLPPKGLAAMADWQAKAQLRLDAEAALRVLLAQAG